MADPAYIVDGVLTDGEAWVGIATTTVDPAAAVVTFTSTDDGQVGDFSQYMDLKVVYYVRHTEAATWAQIIMHLNGDSGANMYIGQALRGNGSTAAASVPSLKTGGGMWYIPSANATANVFGCATVDIFDINSGKYTSFMTLPAGDGGTENWVALLADTYKSQAPVSSVDFTAIDGTFAVGSQFSLFGILPRMVA
jgi:hypothetical protein